MKREEGSISAITRDVAVMRSMMEDMSKRIGKIEENINKKFETFVTKDNLKLTIKGLENKYDPIANMYWKITTGFVLAILAFLGTMGTVINNFTVSQ